MRVSPYVLFIFLLGLNACEPETEVVELTDPDRQVKEVFERLRATGQKNGSYQVLTLDGLLVEESNFVRDTLQGLRRLYDEQGRVQIEESYDHGLFSGPYRTFYPDGRVELEGAYDNNETVGVWKKYYASGALMEEVTFANNMENGPFKEYYENGNLKTTGTYLDGDNEHGELLKYDESGTLVQKMDCQRGICRTIWPDSQTAEQ